MKNIKMNHAVDGKYEVLHPETNMGQVIDSKTGVSLEEMLTGEAGSNLTKIQSKSYVIESTVSTQTEFTFNHEDFSLVDNIVSVHLNGEFMYEGKEYTVVEGTPFPKVKLVSPVPLGSSVHVTVMSNFSIGSTLSQTNLDKLSGTDVYVTYYINSLTGDDTSDGLSADSAWKTITKLNNVMENVHSGKVVVKMAAGTYLDGFNVIDFRGDLTIDQDDSVGDIIVETTTTNLFKRITSLNIKSIRFKGGPTDSYLLAISRVSHVHIEDTVTLDGGYTGIYLEYTNAYIRAEFVNITLQAIYASVLSNIIMANHYFHPGQSAYVTVLAGVKYQSYLPRLGSTQETVNDYVNSSMFVNQVNEGIMVESGSNSNGSYVKFADGTMICSMSMKLAMNTLFFQSRYYPASFKGAVSGFISLNDHPDGIDNNEIAASTWWDNAHYITMYSGNESYCNVIYRGLPNEISGTIYITAFGRWK